MASYTTQDVEGVYVEERDFLSYLDKMGMEFAQQLLKVMLERGHVLDAGVGMGEFLQALANQTSDIFPVSNAISSSLLDIAKKIIQIAPDQRAKLTGVTARKRADLQVNGLDIPGRRKILPGRLFENIPSEEILAAFGSVDLIVDLWGVFAYSHDVYTVLQKYHQILKTGGVAYIKVESALGEKVMVDGVPISLIEQWLPQIKGFQYKYFENEGVVRLTKTEEPFSIPKVIFESKDKKQMPPIRTWIQEPR